MCAIIVCTKYDRERQYMKEELRKTGVQEFSIKTLMNLPSGSAVEFSLSLLDRQD